MGRRHFSVKNSVMSNNSLVARGPLEFVEHLNTPPASDPKTNKLLSSCEKHKDVTKDKQSQQTVRLLM